MKKFKVLKFEDKKFLSTKTNRKGEIKNNLPDLKRNKSSKLDLKKSTNIPLLPNIYEHGKSKNSKNLKNMKLSARKVIEIEILNNKTIFNESIYLIKEFMNVMKLDSKYRSVGIYTRSGIKIKNLKAKLCREIELKCSKYDIDIDEDSKIKFGENISNKIFYICLMKIIKDKLLEDNFTN